MYLPVCDINHLSACPQICPQRVNLTAFSGPQGSSPALVCLPTSQQTSLQQHLVTQKLTTQNEKNGEICLRQNIYIEKVTREEITVSEQFTAVWEFWLLWRGEAG